MSETKKNKGGRPRVDATPITVRIEPSLLSDLDKWIGDQDISRPEAIRQLIRIGLDHSK